MRPRNEAIDKGVRPWREGSTISGKRSPICRPSSCAEVEKGVENIATEPRAMLVNSCLEFFTMILTFDASTDSI